MSLIKLCTVFVYHNYIFLYLLSQFFTNWRGTPSTQAFQRVGNRLGCKQKIKGVKLTTGNPLLMIPWSATEVTTVQNKQWLCLVLKGACPSTATEHFSHTYNCSIPWSSDCDLRPALWASHKQSQWGYQQGKSQLAWVSLPHLHSLPQQFCSTSLAGRIPSHTLLEPYGSCTMSSDYLYTPAPRNSLLKLCSCHISPTTHISLHTLPKPHCICAAPP